MLTLDQHRMAVADAVWINQRCLGMKTLSDDELKDLVAHAGFASKKLAQLIYRAVGRIRHQDQQIADLEALIAKSKSS